MERQLLAKQQAFGHPLHKQSQLQALLKWTARKTDLIELLYALHAAGCFNSGKASLNRIAQYFGGVFGIDLSHFPRDFYEMRIRNDRTPFMDRLKRLLLIRMDNPKNT